MTHNPHGQQPYPPLMPSAPQKPKRARRWPWVLGIAAALFVGIGIGGAGNSTPTPSSSYTSTPAAPAQAAPAVPTFAAPAVEQEPPAPAVPDGTVTNGTYEIGTEVAPGKYKSAGPESGLVSLCYVDVQRDKEFLAQEVSNDGQVRIEIKESWKGALLEVSGCQPLVKQ